MDDHNPYENDATCGMVLLAIAVVVIAALLIFGW